MSPWEKLAFELEQYLTDDIEGAPEAALKVYNEEGGALAHHPEYGWFVVSSWGQGPCVDWFPEGFEPPPEKYGRMPYGW